VLVGRNRSTIWVASGNLAVAMPQIQAAPSPRMVNWRTWSAPRRMPSAFTRSANTGAGSKAAMTLVDAGFRTGYPSLSSSSWVKKTPSLTSRVRARPSSALPYLPAVSLLVMGTPVPSMAA
jgi:hypothetical protein